MNAMVPAAKVTGIKFSVCLTSFLSERRLAWLSDDAEMISNFMDELKSPQYNARVIGE